MKLLSTFLALADLRVMILLEFLREVKAADYYFLAEKADTAWVVG